MKILGVDIGSYSIKIAELETSSKGYTFSGYQEFPLNLDPQADRALGIIEAIRSIASQRDPADTRWVIGLRQSRVSTHVLRFPFRERPKILKSLAFELEDEIPLDIDETVFDAKIIDFLGPGCEVLTVASPKEALTETLELSKDCDFDPDIISVNGLALNNLFSNWDADPRELPAPRPKEETDIEPDPPNPSRLILHIGHTQTLVLVQREGSLIEARTIFWGGQDIANAISHAFSVQIHEAVKMLESQSFILLNKTGASRGQILLSETISESFGTMIGELRLMLLEIRSEFNLVFENLDLSGGVAQIQNLGSFLTQELEIPANIAQPLSNIAKTRVEFSEHLSLTSPVAIGLAIEGLKRQRNPAINLRKGDFAQENNTFSLFWEKWQVPLQCALAAFVIFCFYSVTRDSLATSLSSAADTHMADFAKNIAGAKSASNAEKDVKAYINTQKKYISSRKSLGEAERLNSALDIAARLAEKLPVEKTPRPDQGINITRLTIDNDTVVIEGHTISPGGVSLVERALKELAKGKVVQPMTISSVAPGPGTAFAFNFKVDRKP